MLMEVTSHFFEGEEEVDGSRVVANGVVPLLASIMVVVGSAVVGIIVVVSTVVGGIVVVSTVVGGIVVVSTVVGTPVVE